MECCCIYRFLLNHISIRWGSGGGFGGRDYRQPRSYGHSYSSGGSGYYGGSGGGGYSGANDWWN